jgi:hypothetical protein
MLLYVEGATAQHIIQSANSSYTVTVPYDMASAAHLLLVYDKQQ